MARGLGSLSDIALRLIVLATALRILLYILRSTLPASISLISYLPLQIVFNPSTYPNFLSFLHQYPSIKILPTEMTFSVSRDFGAFEWAGGNLFTVFCQPKRVFDAEMWKLIYDVLKFNACARRILKKPVVKGVEMSIGEYLEKEGYSESFRDNYLIVSKCRCEA